jgi:DNA-binding HxlR family transcriptional regulator
VENSDCVAYNLTPLGKKLVEVLWQLNDWGKLLLEEKLASIIVKDEV